MTRDPTAEAAAWELLQSVLRGQTKVLADASGRKTAFMLRSQDADAEVSVGRFAVHLGARRGHKGAHTYFPELAAQFIGSAMREAGLESVAAPTLIALPRSTLPAMGSASRSSFVWIIPGDPVLVRVRTASLPIDRAWSAPIERAGPLAFPADLPLAEGFGPPTYRRFDPPRPCPECSLPGREFRELHDRLVCRSCGCSFPAARLRR